MQRDDILYLNQVLWQLLESVLKPQQIESHHQSIIKDLEVFCKLLLLKNKINIRFEYAGKSSNLISKISPQNRPSISLYEKEEVLELNWEIYSEERLAKKLVYILKFMYYALNVLLIESRFKSLLSALTQGSQKGSLFSQIKSIFSYTPDISFKIPFTPPQQPDSIDGLDRLKKSIATMLLSITPGLYYPSPFLLSHLQDDKTKKSLNAVEYLTLSQWTPASSHPLLSRYHHQHIGFLLNVHPSRQFSIHMCHSLFLHVFYYQRKSAELNLSVFPNSKQSLEFLQPNPEDFLKDYSMTEFFDWLEKLSDQNCIFCHSGFLEHSFSFIHHESRVVLKMKPMTNQELKETDFFASFIKCEECGKKSNFIQFPEDFCIQMSFFKYLEWLFYQPSIHSATFCSHQQQLLRCWLYKGWRFEMKLETLSLWEISIGPLNQKQSDVQMSAEVKVDQFLSSLRVLVDQLLSKWENFCIEKEEPQILHFQSGPAIANHHSPALNWPPCVSDDQQSVIMNHYPHLFFQYFKLFEQNINQLLFQYQKTKQCKLLEQMHQQSVLFLSQFQFFYYSHSQIFPIKEINLLSPLLFPPFQSPSLYSDQKELDFPLLEDEEDIMPYLQYLLSQKPVIKALDMINLVVSHLKHSKLDLSTDWSVQTLSDKIMEIWQEWQLPRQFTEKRLQQDGSWVWTECQWKQKDLLLKCLRFPQTDQSLNSHTRMFTGSSAHSRNNSQQTQFTSNDFYEQPSHCLTFRVHLPHLFALLHFYSNTNYQPIHAILMNMKPWQPQGGKSGSCFWKSKGLVMKEIGRRPVKSLSSYLWKTNPQPLENQENISPNKPPRWKEEDSEKRMWRQFSEKYLFYYLKEIYGFNQTERVQSESLLVKVLTSFEIGFQNLFQLVDQETISGWNRSFVVMNDLFYKRNITKKFDLKGIRSRKNFPIPSMCTLYDGNWIMNSFEDSLYLHPHAKHLLQTILKRDLKFLSQSNIMDYSLLVGVDQDKRQLIMGLVDYFGEFDFWKKLENRGKVLVKVFEKTLFPAGQDSKEGITDSVTVQPPEIYKNRFQKAMEEYFHMVPDKWMKWMALEDVDLEELNFPFSQ